MTARILMPMGSIHTDLNQELKQYADMLDIQSVQPLLRDFEPVLRAYFPEYLEQLDDPIAILEALGIIIIVDTGKGLEPKRISWSITLTPEEAEIDKQRFLSEPYVALRKALGVSHHWIFVTPERDLLLCSWDELVDSSISFKYDGQPECWIVTTFIYQD